MLDISRRPDTLLIPHLEMRTEACVMVQAAEYYNTCIYHDLTPIHELGENPHIYRISPTHLRAATDLPEFIFLGVVCMTLSHRMNRTRSEPQYKALAETFYHYRGNAIRSLNETINVEHKRTADVVIAGIITLLLTDAQHGASLDWRFHIEAIQRIIRLRGGFRALAKSRSLDPQLNSFVFTAVIGNTTSPASDIAMAGPHLDELDFILEWCAGRVTPFQSCPPPLFAEIVKINHLRMRAAKHESATVGELSQEAQDILSRIHAFLPEQWAGTKFSSRGDWTLLGNIHQAAVELYCISSLQDLSLLPLTSSLRARCVINGQLLQVLLNEALSTPRIKIFLIWPVIVLGVEAVHGDRAMRLFVGTQLLNMSRFIGTYVPLTAKRVLQEFWTSGKKGWDSCFDRPYAFTTQIAVDVSRIMPLG